MFSLCGTREMVLLAVLVLYSRGRIPPTPVPPFASTSTHLCAKAEIFALASTPFVVKYQ